VLAHFGGRVYHVLGDNRRALETYEAALALRREVGDRAGEGTTLNNIGWIYLNAGDKSQARTYLAQALGIAEAVEYAELANAARKGLARARDGWLNRLLRRERS
jgi:tetratricopeptide (TPR) repeat protein